MSIAWTSVSNSLAVKRIGLESLPEGGPVSEYRIHVCFVRGETYVYRVPSRDYFDQFVAANSHGRYYVEVIKARFDYVERY